MKTQTMHPNTQLLLDAWSQIDGTTGARSKGPLTNNHPDLIDALFVIERQADGLWLFRNAGSALNTVLGRALQDHDFLHFWTGPDRKMISGFLDAVLENRLPGIVEANGETLTGKQIEVELAFTPIGHHMASQARPRLLCLYQTLSSESTLNGRPLWRHRLTALHPPVSRSPAPYLKLVANNN
jgi:hypothetical protein